VWLQQQAAAQRHLVRWACTAWLLSVSVGEAGWVCVAWQCSRLAPSWPVVKPARHPLHLCWVHALSQSCLVTDCWISGSRLCSWCAQGASSIGQLQGCCCWVHCTQPAPHHAVYQHGHRCIAGAVASAQLAARGEGALGIAAWGPVGFCPGWCVCVRCIILRRLQPLLQPHVLRLPAGRTHLVRTTLVTGPTVHTTAQPWSCCTGPTNVTGPTNLYPAWSLMRPLDLGSS
jgi:hypothetical protein